MEWEDLRLKNSPRDIFNRFAHYLEFNLDKTYFLCNEGELKVIGSKDETRNDKNRSNSRFSIIVFSVGSAAGVNGTVIFLEKGTKVHPRLRSKKLVTRYRLTEGSCVIPNKG